jgi:hypothetical protein
LLFVEFHFNISRVIEIRIAKMNAHANPLIDHSADPVTTPLSMPDMSLGSLLDLLSPHADKALVFEYGARRVRPGYHVTEVKAGSFVTLDCGGNPDAWQETVLQVEDIPARDRQTYLRVGKFGGILAQVDRKIRLNEAARVTIEISRPDEAMQVYDVAGVGIGDTEVVVRLGERAAICKPRHRAEQAEAAPSACCSPSQQASGCC